MILHIFCLVGSALCLPTNEFESFVDNGELSMDETPFSRQMGIVPSGYSPHKNNVKRQIELSDIFDRGHNEFNTFNKFIKSGHTKKGLTFNIYNDNHREAAIALLRLLRRVDEDKLQKISEWAEENLNTDMYDYVWRLATLYGINLQPISPPFIAKPNYFVNSETIYKAAKIKNNKGRFHPDDAFVNQYYRTDDIIFINTNYSDWNSQEKDCAELNYFREDIGFNSYFYGINLLVPFWMTNSEIEFSNPGMLEFFYYKTHYLYTRYFLESLHTGLDIPRLSCLKQYNPNLVYGNGLPFPVRPVFEYAWSYAKTLLTSIDITMKELLRRRFIIVGDKYNRLDITEDNHLNLIVKLIRANIAGVKTSKVFMTLLGYNAKENMTEEYNPAPSVVHHLMTQMRDPGFLEKILPNVLSYVIDYKYTMPPLDLEAHETNEIKIIDAIIPNLTTYFSYYSFDINRAIEDDRDIVKSPLVLAARQRRLTHHPFHFNLSVESVKENHVAVRLFLGPQCTGNDCWMEFPKFLELDAYSTKLKEGLNNLIWSPKSSNKYSNDQFYNLENKSMSDKYSMYKFPESLLIPRGHEHGLNLTLLVMITLKDIKDDGRVEDNNFYQNICTKVDDKPIGFPFHKQAVGFNTSASNYKLFNVTIFHKKISSDRSGYFSKNLY